MLNNTTTQNHPIHYVHCYRTGDILRIATTADVERAEREGEPHTGVHADDDGTIIFVN